MTNKIPDLLNKNRVRKLTNDSNMQNIENNLSNMDESINFLNDQRQAAFKMASVDAMERLNSSFYRMDHKMNKAERSIESIRLMQKISQLDDKSFRSLYDNLFSEEQEENNSDDPENHNENNFE